MIVVRSSLLSAGTRITGSSPLGNPFKLGDQHPINLSRLENSAHIMMAYASWLHWQIKLQNPVVIQALDDLAYAEIEQPKQFHSLICPCGLETCHGHLIKEVVETKLQEIQHGNETSPSREGRDS